MRKLSFRIFGLLLAIASVPVASAETPAKFKLGFIGSLSGAAQVYGEAAKNGVEMALDEVGRDWVDVVYEDDAFVPAKTVSAFKKLMTVDHVDAVVCVASSPCNAIAPLAESAKVPLFAWASDRRVSTGRPFVVRSYPSGDAEGATAAREAIRLGFDKVAVVISSNDYTNSWRGGFVAKMPKGSVLLNEELTDNGTDFRALIMRARTLGVAQYTLCLNPGQNGAFAKQVRELGQATAICGCEYLHDKAEIDAAHGALDASWFPTVTVTDDFKKRYVEKYKSESVLSGAANHYDMVRLMHTIVTGPQRGEWYNAMVSSGKQQGAVGTYQITEVEGDRFFDIALEIKAAKHTD